MKEKKNKNGLVLEGGGMRGIFTTGVLDFFLEKNISFDYCIGNSAGSCHGASYLAKQKRRSYEVSTKFLHDKRYCSLYSLITTGDLFGADMMYNIIPNELIPIDNETFTKNKTIFKVVITNCITGKAEYPIVKDLSKDMIYIRASSSLPLVSRLVKINSIPYLDGGLADSIPIKKAIKDGNNKNVIILTREKDYRKQDEKFNIVIKYKYKKYPKIYELSSTRASSYNKVLDYIDEEENKGNIFVIRPPKSLDLGRIEKNEDKLNKAYELGYKEAKKRYKELLDYLK